MKIEMKDVLVFTAFMFYLAACGFQEPGPVSPTATVPEIPATPAAIIPLESRLLAAIEVAFPDEIVFVGGFIWVRTDDGRVVQIDPATNAVTGEIKVDSTTSLHDFCQGLGTDGENVWVCALKGDEDQSTIDVVRIDPATRSVVATAAVDKIFDQFTMPFLDNRIWVLTGDGSSLVGIDVATNLAGPSIELGARCFQVAAAKNELLVTCKLDDLLLRVDPESMQVAARRAFSPSPWNIRATEDAVWIGLGNAVQRLDPVTLNPVAAFPGLSGDLDFFVTDDAIWVRLNDAFLYRIDPESNQIVEQIVSDQRFYDMGGLFVTPDAIWTSAGNDDLVLRIGIE